jgi:hypothetical protein
MMKNPDKLIVIVPCQDRIVPEVDAGLRELERLGVRVHRAFGQSAIDAARSRLATQALKAGYGEILWIDSDVGFSVADVQRLRSQGLLMVGGIYTTKGANVLASAQLPQTPNILFEANAQPLEVLYLPGGFLYTRAEVYEVIQRKFDLPTCNRESELTALVPYFQPMVVREEGQDVYLGEDYAFCHRAREAGIRVMADPGIRLTHYGPYGWTLEDCLHKKPVLPRIRLSFIDAPASSSSQASGVENAKGV